MEQRTMEWQEIGRRQKSSLELRVYSLTSQYWSLLYDSVIDEKSRWKKIPFPILNFFFYDFLQFFFCFQNSFVVVFVITKVRTFHRYLSSCQISLKTLEILMHRHLNYPTCLLFLLFLNHLHDKVGHFLHFDLNFCLFLSWIQT